MFELSLEYLNTFANQIIFISALLGGFSLTVLVLLLDNKESSKLMASIFRIATIATGAFLVSIFAMTKIFMMTTKDFPLEVESEDLLLTRVIGVIVFLIGLVSVILIMSISGWTKSKNLGWFTTIIGVITLVLTFLMLI